MAKADFMAYIKGYMAALKKHLESTNPGRVADFTKAAAVSLKLECFRAQASNFFFSIEIFINSFVKDLRQEDVGQL
jgi:hypothetical protein